MTLRHLSDQPELVLRGGKVAVNRRHGWGCSLRRDDWVCRGPHYRAGRPCQHPHPEHRPALPGGCRLPADVAECDLQVPGQPAQPQRRAAAAQTDSNFRKPSPRPSYRAPAGNYFYLACKQFLEG